MNILDELWNKRHPHYVFFLEVMKDSQRVEDESFIRYTRNNKTLLEYNKKTEHMHINYFIFYIQFNTNFEITYKEYSNIMNNIVKIYLNINDTK